MTDRIDAAPHDRGQGWVRPVATPADICDPSLVKAAGLVELPRHVSWSGPRRLWDLADRRQRAQLYEVVLTEGTDDDVRRFIDVDELVALWSDLWLSPHVRRAWSDHLRHLSGIELPC